MDMIGHQHIGMNITLMNIKITFTARFDGYPLHNASYHGLESVVKDLLLSSTDEFNGSQEDFDGWTPLHYAAYSGQGRCLVK